MTSSQDESFMRLALEQAKKAASADEVPVGAVLVHDSQVNGSGFN
jgi:tRNA(adenine34) deaminase